MAGPAKLPFWYRVSWSVNYALLTVIGPASLGPGRDPRERMRLERAARERRLGPQRDEPGR